MNDKRRVKTAGHFKTLYVVGLESACGSITSGVAFAFDNEAGWVVDLDDLEAIVREARARAISKREKVVS